jgi:hypothetical protein
VVGVQIPRLWCAAELADVCGRGGSTLAEAAFEYAAERAAFLAASSARSGGVQEVSSQ